MRSPILFGAIVLASASIGCNGSDGAAGAKGDPGAAGAKGDVGAQGMQGTMGTPGTPGTPGSAGAPGPAGDAGPAGAAGPAGDAGPPGPAGTVDYARAIANGTTQQPNASFNISGSGVVGTTLSVVGDATAARFVPQYDSGWFAVASGANNEIAKPHGLGGAPSHILLQQCGALAGGACVTRVVLAGTRGHQDGSSFVNPMDVTADANNIYIGVLGAWWVWGYWTPASGFVCTGDADNDCFTGYYRVLAWR
jgi:hypothetical protein